MKAGIIAAGDGSRLAAGGVAVPKPLVRVGGVPLLEHTLRALAAARVEEIALIVNERMAEVARFAEELRLPVPVRSVIRTTASSMHSLYHLRGLLGDARFLLCTVDSIVIAEEFQGFVDAFVGHPELELLLSYTDFVDDEKPLYIGVDEQQQVVSLGANAAGSPFVTVGLYGMGPRVFAVLERAVREGRERLRSFLGMLLEEGVAARGFRLSKAVDVDRPEDLAVAEELVRSWRGSGN